EAAACDRRIAPLATIRAHQNGSFDVTALEVVYVGLEMVDCPPSSSSYGQRVSQASAGDRVDASTGSSHDACSATVVAAFGHCRCAGRSDAPQRLTTVRGHDGGAT